MGTVVIDVGRDFSQTPGGRFKAEGDFSGEEFRQTKLEPELDAGNDIIVDLDSALGFTSSFLEEVFGGLIRKYGTGIMRRIQVRAIARPTRYEKAKEYIDRAIVEAQKGGGR